MWGHSMGGYITLRSMVITNTIKAGVIWAGVVGPYPNLFQRPTATPTPEGATPEPTRTGTPSLQWPLAIGVGRDLWHARRKS